jgi:hypothetical protein
MSCQGQIYGQPQDAGIAQGFRAKLVKLTENRIRFGQFLLGTTLLDTPQVVIQLIRLDSNCLCTGQRLLAIALLLDQLLSDLCGGQTRVQAGGPKRRVGLTLHLGKGTDILQQVRQTFLRSFPPTGRKIIQSFQATVQFVLPLANRPTIPAQFHLRAPLPTFSKHLGHMRHKNTAGAAGQPISSLDKKLFQFLRQFHRFPPLPSESL